VRAADLVVVNSDKLAEEIASIFGTERIIHAPLPPYNDVRPRSRESARRSLGLDCESALACYTGKLTEEHSEFLLRACAVASRRVDRFRMLIVGGNPRILDWTRRRVDELALGDAVAIVGFVSPREVGTYLAAADVLVNYIPANAGTIRYATPGKAYEYQAMGKPIVATDFPLFDEVYGGHGIRAIRVAEFTPEAFAAGIEAAFALPDGGREMAERAMTFARGRTWSRRSAMILRALER
jgi:glycosyltransferase involved in cell wall biosynthesis